jgi:hypothetical protein
MRTDKESQHDVTAELNRDPSVDASRFSVEVRDGVATLVERDDWPYEATVAAAGTTSPKGYSAARRNGFTTTLTFPCWWCADRRSDTTMATLREQVP